MSGCDRMQDLIALYASGDLDENERAQVDAHLDGCDACRRAVVQMRSLVDVASSERVAPPENLAVRIAEQLRSGAVASGSARSSFRWSVALGFAGAAVVVFAAGMMVGFQLPGSKVHKYMAMIEQPPPVSAPVHTTRVANASRPGQPASQANESAPSAVPPETPSTAASGGAPQPPPLKAPLPATTDDVRLAMLPPETGDPAMPAAEGDNGAPPSRGEIRVGTIRGRVTYNRAGLPGIHLRLVDAEGSFVPGVITTTDADGRYAFEDIPSGMYRVYAYTGDNPLYFNRTSRLARMRRGTATVGDLQLAMAVEPQEPRQGASVAADAEATFRWTPCPGAAEYAFSVTDEATSEEEFTAQIRAPWVTVPPGRFVRGHAYRWRVGATAADGAFLGASPGAGGEPWGFRAR
jgi:hypothetical protein